MQADSNYKGELLTFSGLLDKYPIEVPIIQRDYAQGRINQFKVRKNFLKALYESLNNEEPLMLDFIYGSLEDDRFQPLDGQQRLTTLFLLHCFASIKCKIPKENNDILRKFSYETRMTSRDFCKKLVDNLNNLAYQDSTHTSVENKNSNSLSNIITDSSWFFLSWKNDPTISAMLNTLDDIQNIFNDIDDIWFKLTQQKIIQFYYIELEHLGLTDDLYIKMNARGKLLTTFENFKASIEKKLKESLWEEGLNIQESFNFKIDGKWTDFFWNEFRVGTSIDEAFVRFIAFVFMVDTVFRKDLSSEERNEVIKQLQDNSHNIAIDYLTKNSFERLVKYLDVFNKAYSMISAKSSYLDFFRHSPEKNFLHEMLTNPNEVSYTQKVLLFSQLQYLLSLDNLSSFDNESYNHWLRVIRNIVSLGDVDKNGKRPDIIRTPQAFVGVLNLISDISIASNDIYNYLANPETKINSTFSKSQVEEERFKASLILDDPTRAYNLYRLENTDILRGRLGFIFYCLDLDTNLESLDINMFDDDGFNQISESFIKNLGNENCLDNNLRRALLTIEVDGEYRFYDYWHSYWYSLQKDMLKRKLISSYREIEYIILSDYREYFKKLLFELSKKDISSIIQEFSPLEDFPQWKLSLIKDSSLLDKSKSKFIAISEDNTFCYLLKSARPRNPEGSIRIP